LAGFSPVRNRVISISPWSLREIGDAAQGHFQAFDRLGFGFRLGHDHASPALLKTADPF
jgi:hypothetical protein